MTQWAAVAAIVIAVIGAGRAPRLVRLGGCLPSRPSRGRHVAVALAASLGSVVVAGGVSPAAVMILAGASLAVCRLLRRRGVATVRAETSTAVVEVTYALAAELRAGRTSAQALLAVTEVAGPLAPALRSAYGAVAVGADAAAELAAAARLPGAERFRAVAAAWAIASAAGGQVAVVLERLSAAMDDEDELNRELDAALAGPRATTALLAGLPAIGLLLGQSVGAHPVRLLLHRPVGWGLLAAAAILDVAGVLIMRAIVSRAQAP